MLLILVVALGLYLFVPLFVLLFVVYVFPLFCAVLVPSAICFDVY